MSKGRVTVKTIKQVKSVPNPKAAHLTNAQIDNAINKVSGSNNYMRDMEVIIGPINTINKEYYLKHIKMIKTKYNEIEQFLDVIRPNTNKESNEFINSLKEAYVKLNISQIYVKKQVSKNKTKSKSKDKEKIRLRPTDIIESPWFNIMKKLEVMTTNLCKQFMIEGSDMSEATSAIINNDYKAVTTFKFFNLPITTVINETSIATMVYFINKHCNDIFNILYEPMYDYRQYIKTHWLDAIDNILANNKKIQEKVGGGLTREDAQNYVALFAKAKYRLGLSKNTGEFTKILLDTLGESELANLDASRFMDIVDNIDVSTIDKTGKLTQTLELAKNNIVKISTGEFSLEEVVKDFGSIAGIGNENPEEEEEEEAKEVAVDTVF